MPEIPEYITEIVYYGSLAPSSHNTQPWKVKVLSESEMIVRSDSKRWLPKVDPENRELMLSIGAFLENLERAAVAIGMEVKSKIIASNPHDKDILKIKLSNTSNNDKEVLDLIKRRFVNRNPYDKKDLLQSHLKSLNELLGDYLEYFPRDHEEGQWIANGLVESNKKQAYNDDKQKELSEWLRFSRESKRDGLTAEMLGISGISKFIWYLFMKKKSALSDSFRKRGVDNVRNQVDNCSGFLVLVSDDYSLTSLLDTGRRFESLALKCTELNISIHPMSQLLEESPWKNQLEDNLGLSNPAQFVIRAGYSNKGHKASMRQDTDQIVQL